MLSFFLPPDSHRNRARSRGKEDGDLAQCIGATLNQAGSCRGPVRSTQAMEFLSELGRMNKRQMLMQGINLGELLGGWERLQVGR